MTTADELEIPGHKVIRTLAAGPNGAVLLAARAVGGWQVVVKTFRPPLLIDDDAEQTDHRKRVAAFVETARMQQDLAARAKRWAPVHDFGRLPDGGPGTGDGAYYTTDSYPAALDWLIRGHVTITGSTLHAIVSGVVDALQEIRTCCNRGHGNLTPANVLLKRREVRYIRVLLTDPAPEADKDPADDEADDRWALGAMIYSLVTHQPMRRMTLLPVAPGGEWAALGRNSVRWLSLCNRLLSRDRSERPDLATVAVELRRLRGVNRQKIVRRGSLAVGAVAVAGVVWLGKYAADYRQACNRLAAADKPWVRSLVKTVGSDPDLKTQVLADPSLGQPFLVKCAEAAKAGQYADDRSWLPMPAKYAAVAKAPAAVTAVAQMLGPERWQTLQQLKAFREEAQSPDRQWNQVVARLDQLTAGLPPEGADDAGARFSAVMTDAPGWLGQKKPEIENEWAKLAAKEAAVRAVDVHNRYDVLLRALHVRAAGMVSLDSNVTASSALNDVEFACDQMVTYFNNQGKQSETSFASLKDSLATALGGQIPADLNPSLKDLEGWVGLDRKSVAEWTELQRSLPLVQKQLDELGAGNVSRDPLTARYAVVSKGAAETGNSGWTADDKDRFAGACRDLNRKLDAIRADATAAAANARLVQSLHEAGPGLSADFPGWDAAVAQLDADLRQHADDPNAFAAESVHAPAWLTTLPGLKAGIRKTAESVKKIPDTVRSRLVREMLDAAVPRIDLRNDLESPGKLMQKGRECDWSQELTKFIAAFPVTASRLDLAAWQKVGDAWMWAKAVPADRDFWVQAPCLRDIDGVNADIAYLDAIALVQGANRARLLDLAFPKKLDAATADASLAARLRLDGLTGTDAWPRSLAELQTAEAWYAIAGSKPDPLHVGDGIKQIGTSQLTAWCRVLALANNSADLKAVIENGQANFGLANAQQIFTALKQANVRDNAAHNVLIYFATMPGQPGITDQDLKTLTWKGFHNDAEAAAAAAVLPPEKSSVAEVRQAISSPAWYCFDGVPFHPVTNATAVKVAPPVGNSPLAGLKSKALSGDVAACKELGNIYLNGGQGEARDADQAIYWFEQGVKPGGDEECEIALAGIYDPETGVEEKRSKGAAKKWYARLDDEHNNSTARSWLRAHGFKLAG
jgi:hypothetical protein